MDKYEYKLKLEQLKNLVEEKNYKTAAEIADSINWRKVKSSATLCMVGEIYDRCKRYEDSHEILLMAYDRAAVGRNILYRLTLVSLKMGNLDEAKDYYEDFLEIAPYDNQKYILRYEIEKMGGASLEELIGILEEFKDREYREEWAFELAYLYHRNGNSERCVEVCDELVLWIGDGKYVEKALELKMLYQPLTLTQEEKYREFMQRKEGVVEVHPNDALESGELVNETIQIPNIMANTGRFNTQNLQAEIAKSMQQILDANSKETVNDTMDNLKKMVEDIPYLQVPQEEAGRTAEEGRYGHIETDEEIDDNLKNDFAEMLAEEWDGQYSISFQGGGVRESQVSGQMGIEEVLADWEKTRMAAEAAMAAAQQKRLESAKARAMEEAWDLLERLHDIIPMLEAGISPKELLEEQYMQTVAPEEQSAAQMQMPEETAVPGEPQFAGEIPMPEGAAMPGEEQFMGEIPAPEGISMPEEAQFTGEIPMPEDMRMPEGVRIPQEMQMPEDIQIPKGIWAQGEAQMPEGRQLTEELPIPQEGQFVGEQPMPGSVQLTGEQSMPGSVQLAGEQPMPEGVQLAGEQPMPEGVQLAGEQSMPEGVQITGEQPMPGSVQLTGEQSMPEGVQFTGELPMPEDAQEFPDSASTWEEAAKILGEPIPEEYLAKIRQQNALKENAWKQKDEKEKPLKTSPQIEETREEAGKAEKDALKASVEAEAILKTAETAEGISRENTEKGLDAGEGVPQAEDEKSSPAKEDAGQYLQSVFEAAKASREEKVNVPKIEIEEQGHISKLSPEQKKIFSYFVPISGMEQQLCQVLEGALHRKGNDNTSASGNILITGGRGSGKTVLATDFIKVIQKSGQHPGGKVGKITGEALNQKELSQLLKKVAGGYLIVEKAGKITQQTATKLSLLMEQDTGGLLVIMEDTSSGIKKLLGLDANFAKKFTERIKIPIFTSDELVEFAKAYADEQQCEIDDMAILALYNRISNIQKLDEATTLTEVKEIVDEAIARAERGGLKKIFGRKKFNQDGYLYLRERDFED